MALRGCLARPFPSPAIRRCAMKARPPVLALLILIAVVPARQGLAAPPVGGEFAPVQAQHGVVASSNALASQAGVQIMKEGGNAIDAAVATGFALAVVHPQAGNIGGGGFMLIRLHDGATHFIDYREAAPAKATATMYQDASGQVIPGLSRVGYKAIGVPGSVKGWHEGDVFRQPELARTLERIEREPDTFYTGSMARELADYIQKGGGLIT